MKTDFRHIVRHALTAKGATVAELARGSGVHAVTLRRWLTGGRDHIRSDTLALVLDALGLKVSGANRRTGAPPPSPPGSGPVDG